MRSLRLGGFISAGHGVLETPYNERIGLVRPALEKPRCTLMSRKGTARHGSISLSLAPWDEHLRPPGYPPATAHLTASAAGPPGRPAPLLWGRGSRMRYQGPCGIVSCLTDPTMPSRRPDCELGWVSPQLPSSPEPSAVRLIFSAAKASCRPIPWGEYGRAEATNRLADDRCLVVPSPVIIRLGLCSP